MSGATAARRLAPLALAALAAAGAEAPPLTAEDVVRAFVAGTPVAEILDEIGARPSRFDLDAEMLEELRRAGLPATLIDAMVARQAEQSAPPPAAAAAPARRGLTVLLRPESPAGGADVPRRLALKATIDAQLRATLGLDADAVSFEDAAIFLACLTATHVPDHWRDASPLGRDFVTMPRHRLLAFVSGARLEPGKRGDPRLELEIPPRLEVELPASETHDLLLGIAVGAGGRYYRVASDRLDGVAIGPEGASARASVHGAPEGSLSALEVRFERPAEHAGS